MRAIGTSAAAAILGLATLVPSPASAVAFQIGHRPEIGNIQAPKTAKAGQPIPITVSAKMDGKYTVRASGRQITTNKECKGSARTVIQVGETKPAKPATKPK